jgi:hypothetical protein
MLQQPASTQMAAVEDTENVEERYEMLALLGEPQLQPRAASSSNHTNSCCAGASHLVKSSATHTNCLSICSRGARFNRAAATRPVA